MRKFAVVVLVLMAAVVAWGQEKTETKPPARNDFSWARSPYRLDYTIKELDDGKVINTRSYSMLVQSSEERGRALGYVRAGSRLPVMTTNKDGQNTTTYMDVGIEINAQLYALEGGNLMLSTNAEVSSLATPESTSGNPILRAIHTNTSSEITAGKVSQFAVMDDPVSKHRFQFEVMATKLR